jgi:hypothetical protein
MKNNKEYRNEKGSRIGNQQYLVGSLSISSIVAGIEQAQTDLPSVMGRFTLPTQVRWNTTVLQPGEYTITIGSRAMPTLALVRDSKGRAVARFVSGIDSGKTSSVNALLLREKDGQLRVYSLALATIGKVLVYDRVLAREAVMEARAPRTVPVMLATR